MKTARNGVATQEIWTLFRDDLARVEQWIRNTLSGESANLRTTVPYVAEVTHHLFNGGGKRVRPLLLLLSSSLCGEEADERRILLASVVEFIHTATLLHDDVIDDAPIRRGRKSPRMIWGNQASILVGDYLYTKALCLAVSLKNHEINETLSEVTRRMTEGELLQLFRNGDPEISEEDYLEIIGCKTAALMSAACRLGGIVGEGSEEKKEALTLYGRFIGTAFQLTDDALDYSADRDR
ncbi:MAG: polyprenyl synthetase family protein, partial [Nitrospirae bacterium]|nr:polyprenyl synthetase family protein [Nitrospirota bacterium]